MLSERCRVTAGRSLVLPQEPTWGVARAVPAARRNIFAVAVRALQSKRSYKDLDDDFDFGGSFDSIPPPPPPSHNAGGENGRAKTDGGHVNSGSAGYFNGGGQSQDSGSSPATGGGRGAAFSNGGGGGPVGSGANGGYVKSAASQLPPSPASDEDELWLHDFDTLMGPPSGGAGGAPGWSLPAAPAVRAVQPRPLAPDDWMDELPPPPSAPRMQPGYGGNYLGGYGASGGYRSSAPAYPNGLRHDMMDNYPLDAYEDLGPVLPPLVETRIVNGKELLCNKDIKNIKTVRLQGAERESLGVVDFNRALQMAQDAEVDLVLVNETQTPPICRLIAWSRYKYEVEKGDKDKKKKAVATVQELKEIRLGPKTDIGDVSVKVKQAAKFLDKGSKLKITMKFEGRELQFKEQGKELLLKFLEDLSSAGKPEGSVNFKSGTYSVIVVPGAAKQQQQQQQQAPQQQAEPQPLQQGSSLTMPPPAGLPGRPAMYPSQQPRLAPQQPGGLPLRTPGVQPGYVPLPLGAVGPRPGGASPQQQQQQAPAGTPPLMRPPGGPPPVAAPLPLTPVGAPPPANRPTVGPPPQLPLGAPPAASPLRPGGPGMPPPALPLAGPPSARPAAMPLAPPPAGLGATQRNGNGNGYSAPPPLPPRPTPSVPLSRPPSAAPAAPPAMPLTRK